jgi:hypothetical protein
MQYARSTVQTALWAELGSRFGDAWAKHRAATALYNTDAAIEPYHTAVADIVAQIETTPALTFEGLLVKGRAFAWRRGNDKPGDIENDPPEGGGDGAMMASILEDLTAMSLAPAELAHYRSNG